jgi:hypothetical protein
MIGWREFSKMVTRACIGFHGRAQRMPSAKWFHLGISFTIDRFGQDSFSSNPSYIFYLYSSCHVTSFPAASGS